MATLLFKNINKIYDNNVQAVFDFNLEVKDKEFIVFVGPSGCGKSTTLRMLAGLETITSGELYIDGKLSNNIVPKDRDIAMVFQSYALYPHMTVFDNMAFSLRLRKVEMPIFEKDSSPEIKELEKNIRGVRRQIKLTDKAFRKDPNSMDLLAKRDSLYGDLFKYIDSLKKLKVQQVGFDKYHFKKNLETIAKLKKEIVKLEDLLKLEHIHKNLSEDDIADERLVFETAITEKQNQILSLEKENEYIESHSLPLIQCRKMKKSEIDVEINKTAIALDISRYLFRKPAALSGGQRQRVALGRAIVRNPKVFLMDEPLSNLDAKLRVLMRSEITKIHERVGGTTIYVTHDQTEAMTMATRIVVMKDGYIQQIGTPKEVYSNPANKFVAGFIGSPSMNFMTAKVQDGKVVVGSGKKAFACSLSKEQTKSLESYEGKEIILGIRPENIHLKGDVTNKKPSQGYKCDCDFSELLGFELMLYFYLNGNKVIARTSADFGVKTHDQIEICFDETALYFFDKTTEQRIK